MDKSKIVFVISHDQKEKKSSSQVKDVSKNDEDLEINCEVSSLIYFNLICREEEEDLPNHLKSNNKS